MRIIVAGCIGWQVCELLGATQPPVFAVIVPIVAMNDAPLSVLNLSLGRLVGVLAGIGLGVLLVGWLGSSTLSVGVILAVALAVGMVLRVGGSWNIQVAVSSLLVLVSTEPDRYAAERLWETAVGAVVTVVLAPLVLPANPSSAIRARLTDAARNVATQLAEAATVVGSRPDRAAMVSLSIDATATYGEIESVKHTLASALLATRGNPLRAQARRELEALGRPADLLVGMSARHRDLLDELPELLSRPDLDLSWTLDRNHLRETLAHLSVAVGAEAAGRAQDAALALERCAEVLELWRSDRSSTADVLLRHAVRRLLDAAVASLL